ncbi:transcriptional regulator [Shewanella psychropiezotolerans]|uniref:Transcriptional regulator n=1 Tax=Shewanella psychropiezotolerans TaxID=2593655 RepID=A0ABX5X302_9GAMM|nr:MULTISPECIES: metalloregulator ArsR/SmtB family transcription factor [Shewanella]MPY23501.1 transcriptional regulator [Shewanella sp. YLB-07]QDO85576.1 transcriptional regulator [Shewanella psychropiezotolerans]
MKTSEKIIQLLKTQGPLTAKVLASELSLTTMGVRQHMQGLEDDGDVIFEDKKAARGRPTRFWSLTSKSNSHFSDRHEELSVQLIDSVITVFGDSGLEKLITHREQASLALYQQSMLDKTSLIDKLNALAELRSREGYMASIVEDESCYWLMENHCPICAAASKCLNFCRSELNLFQTILSDEATVSREEHIIEGARRCAYRVTPLPAVNASTQ